MKIETSKISKIFEEEFMKLFSLLAWNFSALGNVLLEVLKITFSNNIRFFPISYWIKL